MSSREIEIAAAATESDHGAKVVGEKKGNSVNYNVHSLF
jgi:hypothetical protein